jgi:hypothetical protein
MPRIPKDWNSRDGASEGSKYEPNNYEPPGAQWRRVFPVCYKISLIFGARTTARLVHLLLRHMSALGCMTAAAGPMLQPGCIIWCPPDYNSSVMPTDV